MIASELIADLARRRACQGAGHSAQDHRRSERGQRVRGVQPSSGAPFVAVTVTASSHHGAHVRSARLRRDLWNREVQRARERDRQRSHGARRASPGRPAVFCRFRNALDPRKLARQKMLFDEQLAFVLGHELAHHYRGHTGCADGAADSNVVTPQDIGAPPFEHRAALQPAERNRSRHPRHLQRARRRAAAGRAAPGPKRAP